MKSNFTFLLKLTLVNNIKTSFLIFAFFLFVGLGNVFSQSFATIGAGTNSTTSTGSDPIDGYFASFNYQVVYTAAELSAAGMSANAIISGLGFSISEDYAGGNLLGYKIDMGHTTASDCASHNTGTITNVKSSFNYNPTLTASGSFDMITFSSSFLWNGTSNILINICSSGLNPYTSPYGSVRTIAASTTNGSRYVRADASGSQCGLSTTIINSTKPQIRFAYTIPSVPTISSLNITNGCVGTSLVITGTNFLAASAVTIGGTAVASYVVNSATQITATIGSGTTGSVVVTTGGGSATSASVFTVSALPTISSQPSVSSQTICLNGTATSLSVTSVANSGTISKYEWYQNATASVTGGTLITTNNSSATSDSYLPITSSSGTSYYYVVVTNSNGCNVKSSVSGAVITNSPLSITTQPSSSSQTKCVGTSATALSVVASGSSPLYQWYSNSTNSNSGGTAITSATLASYTPLTNTASIGTTYYYCSVSSGTPCSSSVISNVSGAIIVNALPTITGSSSLCEGATITLVGSGTPDATLPWSSATTSKATITSSGVVSGILAGSSIITYKDVNACTITSSITVNGIPASIIITKNPTAVCAGQTSTLSVGTQTLFTEGFNSLSSNFSTSVIGTGTPSSALNTTYFAEGTGSVLFNTSSTSANVAYSLNSNLNLVGLTTCKLNFSHICATEAVYDFGYVEYSADGGTTWTTFPTSSYAGTGTLKNSVVSFDKSSYTDWGTQFTATSSTPGTGPASSLWKSETINIPAAALTSQFRIRFRYTTDGSSNFYGWLIDNLKVTGLPSSIVWSPSTELYSNSNATTPYTLGTNTLTVFSKPSSALTYTALFSANGCSNSNTITVNYNALPIISASSTTLCNGGSSSINASGALTYTWSPSIGLSSATGSAVVVNPTVTSNYTISATDANGCVGTGSTTVVVNTPVSITTQPSNAVVLAGSDAVFSVVASGTGLTYQWQVNDGVSGFVNLSGGTAPTYTVVGVNPSMSGYLYQCIVSGASPCSSVTSNTVSLTISSIAINVQPSSQTICSSSSVTFSISATGASNYQWQTSTDSGLSWSDMPGEINSSISLSSLTSANSGTKYQCLLNGGSMAGGVASDPATLTVYDIVNISTQPVSYTTCVGASSVSFSVSASGSGLTYQWQFSNDGGLTFNNVVGATSAVYIINSPSVGLSGNIYKVLVNGSSPCASQTSSTATLTVYDLTLATSSSTICLGNTVTLTATPSNTVSSFLYNWQCNTSGSDATSPNSSNPANILPTLSGVYTYSLTGISSACTINKTINVSVINPNVGLTVLASASPSIICAGSNTSLNLSIGATSLTYCAIAAATSSSSYFNGFSTTGGLTNVNNATSGFSTGGYGNFTNLVVTQTIGQVINFSTTLVGTTVGVAIWVDWDQSGVFDASERMYNTTSYVSSSSGSFTVPSTAKTGKTRMRILMDYNASNPAAPCGPFASGSRGEVEDYSFMVQPSSFAYSWTDGTTTFTTSTTPSTITLSSTKTYTGSATVNGCLMTSSVLVNTNPLPTASLSGSASVCNGATSPNITFTGANATAPYTFTYTINGGANKTITSAGSTTAIAVPTSTAGSFIYALVNVKESSSTTCSQLQTSAATITVNATPTVGIVSTQTLVCGGASNTVTLTATSTTSNYSWNPTGSTTSTNQVTPSVNTNYTVTSNNLGCIGTATISISVNTPTLSSTPILNDYVWYGLTSVDYNTASNWYIYDGINFGVASSIPTSTNNIIIPTLQTCVTNNPINSLSTFNNSSNDLTIENGGVLTISTGTLHVKGHWKNKGTFNPGTSTVVFNGTSTQSITTTGTANVNFYKLRINKSSGNVILDKTTEIDNNLELNIGKITSTSTNLLIINNGATVSNATKNSYIDGPVRKVGNQVFTFPIGKNGKYAPVSISAPSSTTDHFTAEYFNSDPNASYSRASKEVTLNRVSSCEYWMINKTNGSSSVQVSLSWDSSRTCGVSNLTDLRVAHWDAVTAKWNDYGNGGTTGDTISGSIASSGLVSSFSPFTLGSSSGTNTLPIELLNFNANCQNKKVKLNWSTASEVNNNYFTIERSLNAVNFEPIVNVSAQGNSNNINNYTFTDENPLAGISYYRLKQTDFNGTSKTFRIESVSCDTKNTDVSVYPNPNTGKFTVKGIEQGAHITIMDCYGKLIYESVYSSQTETIDLSHLTKGIYSLSVDNTTHKKIIIN